MEPLNDILTLYRVILLYVLIKRSKLFKQTMLKSMQTWGKRVQAKGHQFTQNRQVVISTGKKYINYIYTLAYIIQKIFFTNLSTFANQWVQCPVDPRQGTDLIPLVATEHDCPHAFVCW